MIVTSTRKDEALDRLTDGIAQLTSSDKWTAWLRVQACFRSYSFNNTILILVRPCRRAGLQTAQLIQAVDGAGTCGRTSALLRLSCPNPSTIYRLCQFLRTRLPLAPHFGLDRHSSLGSAGGTVPLHGRS